MSSQDDATSNPSELLEELMFSFRASDAASLIDRLPTTLHAAGRRSAHRALASMYSAEDDEGECVLRSGMAVEYMAKWYLARIHPMLVAGDHDLRTVVTMIGLSHLISTDDASLRHAKTISGREACQRVSKLESHGWSYADKPDAIVFTARNAVAHLAVDEDEETTATVISIMVRLIDDLLELAQAPGAPPVDEFWGTRLDLVEVIRRERRHLAQIGVEAKLDAARRLYAIRLPSGMTTDSRARTLEGLTSRDLLIVELTLPRTCPACSEAGHLLYHSVDGDTFATGPDGSETWHQAKEGDPVAFICPVCDLDLEHEELDVVGLAEQLHFDSIELDPDE